MHRKSLIHAAVASGLVLLPLSATNAQSDDANVGNCMSDILYGNEPNMADGTAGGPEEQEPGSQAGNVLPSQSPGPWVNNVSDPDNPTWGNSAGAWMQLGVNVPELCRTLVGQ